MWYTAHLHVGGTYREVIHHTPWQVPVTRHLNELRFHECSVHFYRSHVFPGLFFFPAWFLRIGKDVLLYLVVDVTQTIAIISFKRLICCQESKRQLQGTTRLRHRRKYEVLLYSKRFDYGKQLKEILGTNSMCRQTDLQFHCIGASLQSLG